MAGGGAAERELRAVGPYDAQPQRQLAERGAARRTGHQGFIEPSANDVRQQETEAHFDSERGGFGLVVSRNRYRDDGNGNAERYDEGRHQD